MMDQRERLIADLRAAVEAEWAKSPFHQADEWDGQDEERAASFADHLIASGWVRWEVAVERCAKVADECAGACRKSADQFESKGHHDMHKCERQAMYEATFIAHKIRALTPPKGGE